MDRCYFFRFTPGKNKIPNLDGRRHLFSHRPLQQKICSGHVTKISIKLLYLFFTFSNTSSNILSTCVGKVKFDYVDSN